MTGIVVQSKAGATIMLQCFLSSEQAKQLDGELMDLEKGGFTLVQLIELAGLGVAQVVHDAYPSAKRILVIVGKFLASQSASLAPNRHSQESAIMEVMVWWRLDIWPSMDTKWRWYVPR